VSSRRYCGYCRKYRFERFTTSGDGALIDLTPPCRCGKKHRARADVDHDRRRAGLCQRCDEPATGKPKVALYCEAHRKERQKEAQRKHLMKVGNKHQKLYLERHYDRAQKKWRKYHAEHREEKAAYKREWRRMNRDKVKAQKRRYALRGHSAESARRIKERIRAGEHTTQPTKRNKEGGRTCLHPYCRTVMTGRAKMCERHKQAVAA
jgi:hypothetical protein